MPQHQSGLGTRPTSDRVREAVFNALTARLDFTGLSVLDLYAGSGALGLEALSRGATSATFVESDARAAAVIAENITALGVRNAAVRRGTVDSVLAGGATRPVDLVFALAVPEHFTHQHLMLLSQLAEMFSDTGFCARLRQTEDDAQLHRALSDWQIAHLAA